MDIWGKRGIEGGTWERHPSEEASPTHAIGPRDPDHVWFAGDRRLPSTVASKRQAGFAEPFGFACFTICEVDPVFDRAYHDADVLTLSVKMPSNSRNRLSSGAAGRADTAAHFG